MIPADAKGALRIILARHPVSLAWVIGVAGNSDYETLEQVSHIDEALTEDSHKTMIFKGDYRKNFHRIRILFRNGLLPSVKVYWEMY